MPALKFTGGIERKLSNGDYGSFGASAGFELTFDPGADRDTIPEAIIEQYQKARKYVHDELVRQRAEYQGELAEAEQRATERHEREPEPATTRSSYRNGDGASQNGYTNGNGHTKEHHDWGRNRRPESSRGRPPVGSTRRSGASARRSRPGTR